MPSPVDDAEAGGGACRLPVSGQRDGRPFDTVDWVAEEVPVALEYNGISQAVMLASPIDLEDFALGFSLTEGLVDSRHDVFDLEEVRSGAGITLRLRISGACFDRLKDRRRQLAGRTGCGLCGLESLEQALGPPAHRQARVPAGASPRLAASAVTRAVAQLPARQSLQGLTGAVHAAAWCSVEGDIVLLREDVGRHNALDKLIGARARARAPDAAALQDGFIAITSRASFEMVQKAVFAGAPLLAAVSAPTAHAVRLAGQAGLTLAGRVRGQGWVVYSHAGRLDPAG
jgi:FdhD protein